MRYFLNSTKAFAKFKVLRALIDNRGRAEKEPRILIPVPAVPVSELLAGKSQRICNSLNWFKGVTFTFWIEIYRKISSLKSIQRFTNFPVFFLPEVPIPALPEQESKFLVPVLLTPYLFCCLNSNKKWNKYVYVSLEVEDPSLNLLSETLVTFLCLWRALLAKSTKNY